MSYFVPVIPGVKDKGNTIPLAKSIPRKLGLGNEQTVTDVRTRFHLAVPVNDLDAARSFYGEVLACPKGRSSERWIDWNLYGHQFVTHLVEDDGLQRPRGYNSVDGHQVPVPHFGVLLSMDEFHAMSNRLRAAGIEFVIEPYVRFAGQPGEQWTMFFLDPAGNAIEVKAFADDAQVFAN